MRSKIYKIHNTLLMISTLSPFLFFSQDKEKVNPLCNIEGQIAVTTNGKAFWYNMGGPTFKWSFDNLALGLSFMPSLKFEQDKPRPYVVPILGAGPQIYLFKKKQLVLSFPFYYIASRNAWEFTGGIGYVFSKLKK